MNIELENKKIKVNGKTGEALIMVKGHPTRVGMYMLVNVHKNTGVYVLKCLLDSHKEQESDILKDFPKINEKSGWVKYKNHLYFLNQEGFVIDAESVDYARLRGIEGREITNNTINQYSLFY